MNPPSADPEADAIARVAAWLRDARHVCVMTGAGMSAESGVPTFRDAQTGLWARFRPEELATQAAFDADPRRVWQWYSWRREMVAKAEPHAGHLALVSLSRRARAFSLITQNVDGLHQRAGHEQVIELHGNILRNRCSVSGRLVEDDLPGEPPESPHVPTALVRPDVVWFGEALPVDAVERAQRALEACDVLLSIGTSALVEPAASMPLYAQSRGAKTIEINPKPSALAAHFDVQLAQPAGVALPAILAVLNN